MMAARVCAHRTTVPVQLGDFGGFEMTVRRVGVDERSELTDMHKRLRAGVPDEETEAVAGKLREQLAGMVQSVSGVEFEWAPGETEAPKTIKDLLAALERYEPRTIRECSATLWALCVEAQFLNPFSVRPSPSGGASALGERA